MLRDRLTAGQQTLNLFILVRIQVPEPKESRLYVVILLLIVDAVAIMSNIEYRSLGGST